MLLSFGYFFFLSQKDYYDASSEKAAANKDSETKASLPDGGSGNSSAASSVHYVHGENPASENPLVKIMAENPPDEFIPTILTTTGNFTSLTIVGLCIGADSVWWF